MVANKPVFGLNSFLMVTNKPDGSRFILTVANKPVFGLLQFPARPWEEILFSHFLPLLPRCHETSGMPSVPTMPVVNVLHDYQACCPP